MKSKIILLLMALATCLFACKDVDKKGGEVSERLVKTVNVGSNVVTADKRLSGVVKEGNSANLAFKAAGRIAKIAVKEGDFVEQGAVVAELENSDYKLQYDAAKAQYDQVNKEVGRVEELYKRNSVSGNDYDKAVAGRKLVQVQLDGTQSMLDGTRIIAPFSGYVQRIPFSKGELVDAGMPIAELINTSTMEVEVFIPTSLYAVMDKIKSVECVFDVIPNKSFPLTVIGVNPKSNNSQLYKMRLAMKGTDKRIAPGMSAQITYELRNTNNEPLITLPLSAMFEKDGKAFVWVVDSANSTISMREITTKGFSNSGQAIITSGLENGETVVAAGVNSLSAGEKVKNIVK